MKLRTIVVGVDFCRPSIEAARWTACHLAPDADVVIVHAVDVPAPPSFLRGRLPPHDELVETVREGAGKRFEEMGAWTSDPRISLDVRTGPPAETMVEAADVHGADLMVVGEHGCRPGLWDLLGSTAERVIADAAVPVLLGRGLPPAEPERILVAVGESEAARRELAWARFLAGRFGADVIALHAVAPSYLAPLEITANTLASVDLEASRKAAREWIAEEAAAAGFGPDEATIRVEVGDPAHEILAVAAAIGADLVVMGSRGAGALAGGLAGSVARAVLRRGHDPVLVVGPLGR
ncbi:MAG: universal stress protein [Gemmatimonadota bacterium]|nr:universal stress protein [Gemmatimonadota bacterium]